MKQFKSYLAPQFEQYIRYRRRLGYETQNFRSQLLMFDRCLVEQQMEQDSFTPAFFLQLQTRLPWQPTTTNTVFSNLRMFFQYLVRKEDFKENPLKDIPRLQQRHYIPFVFSPEQTDQLLSAVCKRIDKTRTHYLNDSGVYLVILLLARCGLRISEPLRLLLHHYRPGENTLYIERTKFKKDRLIPIPNSVAIEIENYLALREVLHCDDQNPYLLAGQKQKGLLTRHIYRAFHQAVKDIGLEQSRKTIANTTFGSPTPHSLRHSFAINTLKRIREQGKSVQNALPTLAVYLGHSKYIHTLVYLKVLDAHQRQGLFYFAISKRTL
jgi:site-specific recombinase XerD